MASGDKNIALMKKADGTWSDGGKDSGLDADLVRGLSLQNNFRKIIYVDEINGSDDNDGLTEQTAFKTLKFAIENEDNIPNSTLFIYLLSDITISDTIRIYPYNPSKIYIFAQSHTITPISYDVIDPNGTNVGKGLYGFEMYNTGHLMIKHANIELPACTSTGDGNQWFWRRNRVFIQAGNPDTYSGFFSLHVAWSDLKINDYAYFVSGSNGTNLYPGDGYIYASAYSTTINLDPDGDGNSNDNGFAYSDVQIVDK